ncbi:conserved hypothetical protein [Gammaproteobacteria bacterium]
MFALEIETTIDHAGNVHVPEQYRQIYGKSARLLLLLPEDPIKTVDPMQFSNTIAWPLEALTYQQKTRSEWD